MSYLPPLIGVDEAMLQVNITSAQTDLIPAVAMYIEQASAIAYRWQKLTAVPDDWIVANTSPALMKVPQDVKAFTLHIFAELYLNRESSTSDILPETLKQWARQFRDPTIA